MSRISDGVIHRARERGLKQALKPSGQISQTLITALDACVFSSCRIYFIIRGSELNSQRRDYSKEINLIFGLADVHMQRVDREPAEDSFYRVTPAELARLKLLILENSTDYI